MKISRQNSYFLALFLPVAFGSGTPSFAAQNPYYLSVQAIDLSAALSAPPAQDSPETQSELQTILTLQNQRSAEDCQRANFEAAETFAAFFGAPYGSLTAEQVNQWSGFFDHIQIDSAYFEGAEKKVWNRPRPFLVNSAIKPCIPEPSSSSYPSGHATRAEVFAEVLGLLDPVHQEIYLERARQIGSDRTLGGVHFPSDVAAGYRLGDEIFQALQTNSQFQNDLEAAKK